MKATFIRISPSLSITDKENEQIDEILHKTGLKKGAFYAQAIREKIQREKDKYGAKKER